MKIREIDIPDTRPFIVRAADYRPSNDFNPPNTLGKPKGKDNPEAKRVMAMDGCIKNVLSGFKNELYSCGTPMFAGYGMLSSISQEALIRAGVETIADEMTRKFVKFRYDVDDGREDHEKEISDLEEQAAKYKLKDIFNDAAQKDGYFGGCLVYIDVGELDDEEALEPLTLDKKTFKKGMLKGFKVIEPINIYPGEYNTNDPTDEHYFNPEYWYILGKRYHASRFLYFCGNSVPVLLKPAYNFFGIARAQLALDYIAHFVENRESAQELLNKFSLTCWKTDMSQVLAGESCNDLVKRVRMFNKMKSNNGTLVVDKEQEDILQLNTPLAGVRDIVDMSLSLLTAVWRIPKIKYIGEGEGGLNASSKEQMRSFYDFILSQKEKMFTEPMEKVLKILQLNMGKDINESIGFEFPSLVEMDDSEIAQLNKMKAETAVSLINAGVVSQEEVRQNLSMDKHSGFSMIDVDDMPEQPEQPNEKEVVEVEDRDLITDEFVESEHPRDDDGKFTKSSSGKNALVMTEKQWEYYSEKKDNKGYPVGIGKTLSIIKKNKYGGKELHTDGEFYGKNLRSALSKFIKNSPKEVSQWNYLLEDSSDKELEEFLFNEEVDTDTDYIKAEHIRDEEGKSLFYFWALTHKDNEQTYDMAMDEEPESWITMNGNHIPLFKGQSKEDAIKGFLEKQKGNIKEKENENGKSESRQEVGELEKTRNREALVRRIRERLDSGRYNAFVSNPYKGGSEDGLGDGLVKNKIELADDLVDDFSNAKLSHPPMFELNNSLEAGKLFAEKISNAKKEIGDKASSVYVYPAEEYKDMKMFLSKDGSAGFAVKKDGDIVSVFSTQKGLSTYMLQMAIANGGEKLDCFDTYLTKIYKENGFVEYGRDKWNEEYKPQDWNKEYYKQFNNGEPDVVYMKIKKTRDEDYKKGKDETFDKYAEKFDDSEITEDKVLRGLDTYISESGVTHDPKAIKKAIEDVEKKIRDGEETISKYRISGRRDSAVYSKDRQKVHEEIISKLLEGKQESENPTFILLGGRGGSGKSKFNGEVYDKSDFVVLDADKIKEMLPEYEGWNAAHLHEESSDILEQALNMAKNKKLNVVLDATMNGINSTKRRLDLFKNNGYHTEMHYMFLPRQKAARRAITRFVDRKNGRYVPIDKILDMKDNEKNFQELTKYVDSYSFSNNDVPFGSMPRLVEKKGDFYYKKGGKKWI